MLSKTNSFLVIGALILSLILGFEVYYLFFYQQKPTNYQTNESKATQTTGGLSGFWKETTQKVVDTRFGYISKRNELIKPLFKTGVLKAYSGVEYYRTIITGIGPKDIALKTENGATMHTAYEIKFSTQSKTGDKDLTLLLSAKELTLVTAYKAFGDERIPIKLSEIKVGDFVAITVTVNYFADPENGFSSIEIEKLL